MAVAQALRREAGQTLVEVVAAAALLLVIAVSTTTVLISSDKAAGSSSARAGAASLLGSEQQRLRSLSAVGSLTDYSSTRTTSLPAGGAATPTRSYTVTSTVVPARDSSGDVSCTTDASAPDYLHARTSVTWRGGGPLVGESLISPSSDTQGRTLGTLGVQVVDRDTKPVPGATVVVVGGRTRTTNALGCVVLSNMAAGTYGVSAALGSEVAPDGSAPATTSATVVAGTTAQATLALDAPGDLPVTLSSATAVSGVTVPSPVPSPTSLSVTNADPRFNGTTGTNAPKPRVLPWSSTTRSVTGLFPFASSAYGVYAGTCSGNDPATWSVPAALRSTATVASGSNAGVVVRMPTVVLQLTGPSNPNGIQARLYPDTSVAAMGDCTGSVTMPPAATVGSTRGITSLALPYGSYTACAATTGYKVTGVKVANTSAGGTAVVRVAMALSLGTPTCP